MIITLLQVEIVLQIGLIGFFGGIARSAKLQSTYIPPNFAVSSGGHDSFLNPPSNQYLPPAGTPARKSNFLQPSAFAHMKHHHRGQSFTSSLLSSTGYAGVSNGNGGGDGEDTKPPVPILKYENNNLGGGTYNFE